jgi:dolichyl-diphosphooligosaccharide--protein glycosyltransferase
LEEMTRLILALPVVPVMSDDHARTRDSTSVDAVPDWLRRHYQVPAMALILAFMLWVRIRAAERFVHDGEVFFSGNDPWYHLRQVTYTVRNYPEVMPFDVWTQFPYGTSVGQFGTLFDQIVATTALVVGLGTPDQHTVAMTLLYAPAVFGALVAIPTYLLGRRLQGQVAGLVAAGVLALLPGLFLRRGLVGTADHNIAEPFFQAFAVLAMGLALAVAARERPVWEQFAARDVDALRPVVGWSALAGVAVALYLWTWPPGILLVGIFGVFFTLFLSLRYARGASPEHAAIAGAVAMGVTALLALVPFGTVGFDPVRPSLVQPVFAALVAVGCVFMAWLARGWDARDLPRWGYPATVFGLIALLAGLASVLTPDIFGLVVNNLQRFIGFSAGAGTRTIAEAQPTPMTFGAVFGQYGLTFFVAVFAALLVLARSLYREEANPEEGLVLVWFLFMIAAAFTQVRFNYYLAVPVAVLSGYVLGWGVDALDAGGAIESISDVEAYQVMVALLVAMVVFVPLVVPVTSQSTYKPTAPSVGEQAGPGADVLQWNGALQWMERATPAEGHYGGADNAQQLRHYGTYPKVDDYNYPEGAYGVMSWWDYGHWITVLGERIPNANPFQQGARRAANFLLAPNESDAAAVLAAMDEEDAETRYVMVDWMMVTPGSKFGAPTVFYNRYDTQTRDFRKAMLRQTQSGGYRFGRWVRTQRYYESMMVRLYRYHGSAQRPQPVVVDWSQMAADGRYLLPPEEGKVVKQFDNMSAARTYVQRDGTSQIGGIGQFPSEYVPALQHYRLVKTTSGTMPTRQAYSEGLLRASPAYVKVFERVPGATIRGEAPPNTTVAAAVPMRIPSLGTTFTYVQRAEVGPDGEFNMTVPYSTTGYGQWGPEEGYTNISVRANGSYTFTTSPQLGQVDGNATLVRYRASAEVPEAKVIGEDDSPVRVTLEAEPIQNPQNGSGNGSANASALSAPAPSAAASAIGASAGVGDEPGSTETTPRDRGFRPHAPPIVRV